MSTYGDVYKEQLLEAIEELANISKRDYETDEVKAIISKVGIRTELFLKNIVFSGIRTRIKFFDLINELLKYGLTSSDLKPLHELRLLYNDSKHEPTFYSTIIQTKDTLDEISLNIDKVLGLGLGITNKNAFKKYRRIFWISAWWYIEGDIEVHIMFPDDSGRWLGPPSIDIIYVDTTSWEQIKLELQQVGSIYFNLPAKLLNDWNNEGDEFLEAFSFDGYYKELIFILSQHEKRLELMPGLMRHHELRNMVQACLLASIDIFPVAVNCDKDKLIEELKIESVNSYAVPSNYKYLDTIAEDIVNMLLDINKSDWNKLSGIRFLNSESYDIAKESACSISKEYTVLVDDKFIICIAS
nr:hypothetical protein [Sedimentibacter sp.]